MRTSWSLASCAVLGMLILQMAARAAVTYSFGPETDVLDAAFYTGQPVDGSDVAGRMAFQGQVSNDGKRVYFYAVNAATAQLAGFLVDLGYPSSWRRLTPDVNYPPSAAIHWAPDNIHIIAGPFRVNTVTGAYDMPSPFGYAMKDSTMTQLPDNNWMVTKESHNPYSDILMLPVLNNAEADTSRAPIRVTNLSSPTSVDTFALMPDGSAVAFASYNQVAPGTGPDQSSVYVLKNLAAIMAAPLQPDNITSQLAPTSLDDPNIIHIRAEEIPRGMPACSPYYPPDHTKLLYFEDWNSKFENGDFYGTVFQADFDVMVSNADGSGADFRITRPGNQVWATTTPDGSRLLYANMTGPTTCHLIVTTLVTSNDVTGNVVGDNQVALTAPMQASDLGGNTLEASTGTVVTFPQGAAQSINMNTPNLPALEAELPPDVDAIPMVCKFEPEGTTFSTPVSVTVPYTHNQIVGMDEASLLVFLFNTATGKYDIEVNTITGRDLVNNTITFTVDHFSTYGVAAQAVANRPYREVFDTEWETLKALLGSLPEPVDIDHDGLPEAWALRLVAIVLGDLRYPQHDAVYAAYMQNFASLASDAPAFEPFWEVLAALLLMSDALQQDVLTGLGLTGSYAVFTEGKSPDEPLSGAGDIDHDGFTNAEEYGAVFAAGGSMEDFAQSALYWQGAGSLPVAGSFGLGLMLVACGYFGGRAIRRRQ